MHFLALSGSLRAASTNTALLRAFARTAPPLAVVTVYDGIAALPAFSPDREGDETPPEVLTFAAAVSQADGLVISCPEYVHAVPGAFKNAIDWLVSRDELIGKPVALLHASHRGEDVLADLRRVLSTVSDRFAPDIFARFELMKLDPDQVALRMEDSENRDRLIAFTRRFADFVAAG